MKYFMWGPLFVCVRRHNDASCLCSVSGHTHGGQFFPMVIVGYLSRKLSPSFFAGLYRYRHGYVYVTQGAVYSAIPMRMFSEAEITRLFLRSA